MLGNLNGWHLLIVLAVILLLFGATRLPALSRSLGQSIKIFRREVKSDEVVADDETGEADEAPAKPKPSGKTSDKS